MDHPICVTCGVQQAGRPPGPCAICADERQYVGWQGQRWTTMAGMRADGYRCELRPLEPGLVGVGVEPSFAIGQRALLVCTPGGNVLWDCVSLLDEAALREVRALGGIAAIAASHPHFYGSMVEWSHAFGAPVLLPRADAAWVLRPDPAVQVWDGRLEVVGGVTLVQCGGHFEGSSVLHWAAGAGGRGALLVGDTVQVVRDRRWVSFMRSFPNLIPLPAAAVHGILQALRPLRYDRIYGGWWDLDVAEGAAAAVERSAARYLGWLEGAPPPP